MEQPISSLQTSPTASGVPGTLPPFISPDRPKLKMRPLIALRHFRNLMADKENTAEVFRIFQALPRKSFFEEMRLFTQSEEGIALRRAEPGLLDFLDDHASLRDLPEGSLAHAYCDFMEREGLTAAGLAAEWFEFMPERYGDLVEWFIDRNRDTHDLLHVLTGYGRDALGEACVLAFTYGQSRSPAYLFIAWLAALEIKRKHRSDAPVLAAIAQAQRMGKRCPRLIEEPIMQLMTEPLVEVRNRFRIGNPSKYRECHAKFRAAGLDPYKVIGAAAA